MVLLIHHRRAVVLLLGFGLYVLRLACGGGSTSCAMRTTQTVMERKKRKLNPMHALTNKQRRLLIVQGLCPVGIYGNHQPNPTTTT